ncbi:MAG: MMPL family transporter, partial [Verrucomicrobiales bacterium]
IILIHSLFFLFYRRLVPIVWLVLCLALTFTITLTIGSFIFDKLGAMSVGFAAILIGLAVDYGFVIYQESLKHGSAPAQLRRRLGYSIGWASVTTAAVFICLRLSSLPGASQLGTMVGIGIVVGALVMLSLFTWLNHLTPTRAPEPPSGSASPRPPKFFEGAVTAGLIGASILVIILCGPPGISTSADDLKPKESRASQVFIEIWDQFGWGKRGGFQLVIAGDDEVEVGARLATTRQVLADDKSKIPRELLLPPPFLFANPGNQLTNRAHAREAVVLGRNVLAGALAIDRPENLEDEHVEDTLALAEAIFAAWERFDATPDDQLLSPTSPSSRWVLDSVISHTPDPVCALGSIRLPESSEATDAEELRLAALLSREGVYPAAWPLLRPAIARIIGHEIYWVVLPTAALLFALLWLAFRRLRRVALSLAALAFSFLTLLAVMSLIGARWNLMNLASIPLLLGAGLDYSIHMQ